MSFLRHMFCFGLAACLAAGSAQGDTPAEGPWDRAQLDFFETKVRPVLAEHCFGCHSARADKLKGGLLLDSREGLLKGGDSGGAVVPGEPEKSRLIEAVGYGDQETAMPPKGRLPDGVVKDLEQWVAMGVPWAPAGATPAGGGAFAGAGGGQGDVGSAGVPGPARVAADARADRRVRERRVAGRV